MALGDVEPIDLTLDDDEDSQPPAKRARTDGSGDSDVELVSEPQAAPCSSSAAPQGDHLGDDEDLIVTKHTGQVWNEHLPHQRYQCGLHPFRTYTTRQNMKHCDQCFCFICDVCAASCTAWGNGAKSKDHCNAHAGSAYFCGMRDDRQLKASSETPAQPANRSHHIHPSSSAHAQPAARPLMPSGIGTASAAHLSRRPAQATPTGLSRNAITARLDTIIANASAARAARCNPAARATEAAPARAVFMPFAKQPARPRRQRLNLSEIWGDAHLDREVEQQATRLQQHTAELDDEWEADVGPRATAASQAPRSASLAQALVLPRPLIAAASASATSSSDEDASMTTAESSQPAGSDDSLLPPHGRGHGQGMRQPAAAAGTHASTPSLADAAGAPASRPATGPAPGAAAPAGEPAAPTPPELLPLPPELLQPDPTTLTNLVHVGTLQFPFKVKAPYIMSDLTERLVPNGVYVPSSPVDPEPDRARSSRLHINSFSNLEQRFITLQPLPQPEAEPRVLPERIFPVTVISSDGRKRPMMFGMPVKQGATYKELAEAASQQEFAMCSNSEAMLLLSCPPYSIGPRNVNLSLVHKDEQHLKRKDEQHLKGYVGMLVPKLKQPEESTTPAWVLIQSRRRKEDEDGNLCWCDKIAYDVLLPLPRASLHGGRIAAESIGLQLLQALGPYRKPGSPHRAPHECFSLMRCNTRGHVLDKDTADFRTLRASSFWKGPVILIQADWHPAGLALFDTEAWGDPEVHASAATEVLAGTQERLDMDELKRKCERESVEKAASALQELAGVCNSLRPTDRLKLPKKEAYYHIPTGQCKLAILPGDSVEGGTLQVEVFLSRVRVKVGGNKLSFDTLFKKTERRYPAERKRSEGGSASLSALTNTMELLLGNNFQAKAMYKEMKEWAQRVKGKRLGVTTLMEMLQAGERPAAPQPQGLSVELHPFQRQALRFMLDNEHRSGGHRDCFWVPVTTPGGEQFWYSPLHRSVVWKVPAAPWGGFLAEEMGCGKTVEMLALILSNPAPIKVSTRDPFADRLIKSSATLVVCAVSLVGQWLEEAKSKLDGSLALYMYHGSSRKRDAYYLATNFDLVITTYQTLGSDWRSAKDSNKKGLTASTLHRIKWHRIILDESHTIKAGGANQALACCSLQSDRRWCCSGTPISTEIKDFAGQFAFLHAEPFDDKAYINNFVNASWQSHTACNDQEVCNGTNALLFTLGRMLMRHTKAQTIGGQEVSQLPPKTEESLAVSFSKAEAESYMRVHQEANQKFQGFLCHGAEYINRHLLSIMSLLGPLRRCCSGGALRKRELVVPDVGHGKAPRRAAKAEAPAETPQGADAAPDESQIAPLEECSVCLNGFERPTITPCAHWFCRDCILAVAEERASCPLCRKAITVEVLREGVLPAAEQAADAAVVAEQEAAVQEQGGLATRGNPGGYPDVYDEPRVLFESKLSALLKELAAMRTRDPAAKALVFTQFSGTLNWLAQRLQEEGYGYRTISGSMPLKKRAQAIEAFQKDPPTTVFLLSMRSGAVGINLTAANHVFLMEPAFNPALEAQAIGRAHRMGQTRPVVVKKFYIKGSVEERIMEMIEQRKKGLQQGSSADGGIDEEGGAHRGMKRQRAQQDVAGSLKADRQNLRTAELELLFQAPAFAQASAPAAAAAAYDLAPAPASC